jgi:hypothetical protein
VSRRTTPLTIAGPPTLSARLQALQETMFPDTTESDLGFPLDIVELEPQVATQVNGVAVTAYPVRHGRLSLPSIYRINRNSSCSRPIFARARSVRFLRSSKAK